MGDGRFIECCQQSWGDAAEPWSGVDEPWQKNDELIEKIDALGVDANKNQT